MNDESQPERHPTQGSILRRHKLAVQSLMLLALLTLPVFLYWSAQAGAIGWELGLFGLLAAAMVVSSVVS